MWTDKRLIFELSWRREFCNNFPEIFESKVILIVDFARSMEFWDCSPEFKFICCGSGNFREQSWDYSIFRSSPVSRRSIHQHCHVSSPAPFLIISHLFIHFIVSSDHFIIRKSSCWRPPCLCGFHANNSYRNLYN